MDQFIQQDPFGSDQDEWDSRNLDRHTLRKGPVCSSHVPIGETIQRKNEEITHRSLNWRKKLTQEKHPPLLSYLSYQGLEGIQLIGMN